MKCRNLSEKDHNIIWFGKDMSNLTHLYYEINKDNVLYKGTTKESAPASGKTITIRLTPKDAYTYTWQLNENSTINGTLTSESGGSGVGSLTNKEKIPNYVEDTDAVVVSLIQRLSVIKGELWWQVNYGMPLTDKVRGTTLYDMVVTDIITSHPGVASIQSYSSNLVGHTYTYTCTIKTVFGDTATISN